VWYWVITHDACFGMEEKNGIVTVAPFVARWTIGKKVEEVLTYFKKRGAEIKKFS